MSLSVFCIGQGSLNAAVQSSSSSQSDKAEVDSPLKWPSQVAVPKRVIVKEVSGKKFKLEGHCYATKNFIFSSPVELDAHAQENAGRLLECAFAANQAIAKVLPVPRCKKNRSASTRLKARFFQTMEDYYDAGASKRSNGYFKYSFQPGKILTERSISGDIVMVPFPSLGFSKEGKVLKDIIDSHTLVHELTHQCTCLNQLPVWANEGMAEYVGYVPYDGKLLDFDKCFETIVANAKRRAKRLSFPFTFEDFLVMSQDEMYEHMDNDHDTYMLSTLCIAYFVHLEGRTGVRNLQTYMKYLLRGKDNEKVVDKLFGRIPLGETRQGIFLKAWAEQGVKMTFKGKGSDK